MSFLFFSFWFYHSCPAQNLECGQTLPDGAIRILIDQNPEIEAFKQSLANQSQSMQQVPVRFTTIKGDGSSFSFDLSTVNWALNYLNNAFAAAGINFVMCGDLNEMYDARIRDNTDIDQFITSFSYASGAMEVYVKPSIDNQLPLGVVPLSTYYSGNPNWNNSYPEHTNWIYLRGAGDVGPTFAHETGHHFGLLHTHHVVGNYTLPVADDAQDHPYEVLDPTGEIQPWWWGRELVIRNNEPSKQFAFENTVRAGDLIDDTPADCAPTGGGANFLSIFPGCLTIHQNLATCELTSSLTYKDYNNDPIYPPPAGLSLGRNYMSYWDRSCLNSFTPGQITNIMFHNQVDRQPFYATSLCGNFTDKVEFEGSATALHNVTLRVRHSDTAQKCNVTSSQTGNFSGIFHSDAVKVHAYHNGKNQTLEFAGDPLKMHFGHKKCEWIRGINSHDLFLIKQHILSIQPLVTGYRKIAADANQSLSITTTDITLLRKLISLKNYYIPGVEQPWQFIPEFIPQNSAAAFDANPFNLFGGAYLQQGWPYLAPPFGQRGFDGIKIGDVNSSWPTDPEPCMEENTPSSPGNLPTFSVSNTSIDADQTIKLTFKVQDFNQITDFQLGIKLPVQQFELLDILDNSLENLAKEDAFGLDDLEQDAVRLCGSTRTEPVQP